MTELEYKVIKVEYSVEIFNKAVNLRLKDGWVLFGPPSFLGDGQGDTIYLQAMTKVVEED